MAIDQIRDQYLNLIKPLAGYDPDLHRKAENGEPMQLLARVTASVPNLQAIGLTVWLPEGQNQRG